MENIKITIDRLQLGLYIHLPVKWNEHPFLLNSFKLKNQEQIDMIRHLGISHVLMNPNKSDNEPLPPPSINDRPVNQSPPDKHQLSHHVQKMWEEKKVRIEKLNAYRRRVQQCEKEFDRSLAQMRAIMNKIRNRPQDALHEATQLIDSVVDKLLSEEDVTLHIVNSKSTAEDIYFHSMNVAILSIMIGKAKRYHADKIKLLALSSLFHDMGKTKIPSLILRKKKRRTEPEENYFRQHTRYGVEIANTISDFPEEAKIVIAQHHEMMDGSGYPAQLKGDEIHELAQIVALTNEFDTLCHSNLPKEQKIPYTALSHLYKQKHLYNTENLNILIKYMGVYPPGSIVLLSNDMVGLVISVNSNQLLYPSVLIYDSTVPRTQAPIIDLSEKDELSIVTVLPPTKVADNILEYLSPRERISYFFDTDDS